MKKQRFRSKDCFESVLGLAPAPFGSSWGSLGSSLGPLDRPKRASRFVLEFSWASFARFLLLKMAWGAPMSFFISSRSLLWSILSSQTDPPIIKNDDFMMAGARFLKNHNFQPKGKWFWKRFGSLSASFWARLGLSGGLMGVL